MKLLFILDSVEYPFAPTPAIARRSAHLLAEKGHTVHFLELYDGQTLPHEYIGCSRTLLPFSDERIMNRVLEGGRSGQTPISLRLLRLCGHPKAALAAFRQIVLKRPRRMCAAKKAIETLDKQYHFDAAVAVAAPYSASFALAKANFGGKKASWEMDPYAANRTYSAPGAYDKEKQLCTLLNAVFITPLMQPDYMPGGPLAAFAEKAHTLDFPSLVPIAEPLKSQQKNTEFIRCVFVGSLYPELRTPHYVLQLFAAMDDPHFILEFVGGGWENYPPSLLEKYRSVLGDRLIVTGAVPSEQARQHLADADVLINLGNGVDNQVPSKIFEYFAVGKPILHLAKIKNDPCQIYFDRWPLALCIQESDGLTSEILCRVRTFLQANGHSRIPYEQAERLFAANTPKAAAHCIETVLGEHTT